MRGNASGYLARAFFAVRRLAVAFFAVRRLAVAFLGGNPSTSSSPRPFEFHTDYSFFTPTSQEVKAAKPVPAIPGKRSAQECLPDVLPASSSSSRR